MDNGRKLKFSSYVPRHNSDCAVEMTMYVHWTCININKTDVYARMISIIGKAIY